MTSAPRWLSTALLASLLTTGCTMTTSEPELRGPLVAEDVVRLDLRDPPTREEAGFAPGRNSLLLERVGEALDVEIVLPGDRVLRTEAFGVDLNGPLGQTEGDRAVRVSLIRRLPDIAAVRGELLEEAEALALDPAVIESFADQVDDPPSESNSRVLTAAPAQPPLIDVEARYSDASRDWVLMYRFTFPDPA